MAAGCVAGLGALPGTAGAVVTFGSNLSLPANSGHLSGVDATEAIGTLPATSLAPGGQTSPIDGVIVRWRIKMGNPTTPVALRVIRPGDSEIATGAGTGETVAPPADTTSEFPARLPVRSGDGIGVNFGAGETLSARSDIPGATTRAWFPLQDDAPPSAGATFLSRELLINADVEPDCDSDGLGDETQDPSLLGGSCPIRSRTLTLDASENRVKKGKKVTLSGQLTEVARQGECQAAQSVELQRKKPSQSTFATFDQVASFASGSFSAKEKVKKTFEYRAQVPETATCGAALSNTEKVKVKKRKR